MIEKNNPFSLKKNEIQILSAVLKDKKTLDKISLVPSSKGLVLLMENITKVIENGYTIIEVKEDDFNSPVSRNTIENIPIKDILMPFSNFCIRFKKDDKYECIFIWNKENEVLFSKSDKDGVFSCVVKKDDDVIKNTLDVYNKTSINMILDSLSVIMYFTAFKKERNRVDVRVLENKNRDSKKIAKTISLITLNSNIYSNLSDDEPKGIFDKSWIVKGHWRNQYYSKEEAHKPKWIDCYWKGQSKEVMQKIYKV